jgi:hypothetical protein
MEQLFQLGDIQPGLCEPSLRDVSAWKTVPTPESVPYLRHLKVLSNPDHLLIVGGGHLPPSTTNKITVSVIDLEKSLKDSIRASFGVARIESGIASETICFNFPCEAMLVSYGNSSNRLNFD